MASDPFRELVEEAVADLREAANEDPDSVEAIRALADASLARVRLGRAEEALTEIEVVLEKQGDADDPQLRGAVRHVLCRRRGTSPASR
jgi:thioredoxin-like negative regulator of GroEL